MQDQSGTDVTNHQLQFTGSGAEYFRIWIVNILLTVVTLYIYSAWAKVRSRRYFYGNTVLNNSPFEYHATGKQLLPGRLIGLALVAAIALGDMLSVWLVAAGYIVLILIAPWALCRSRQFNSRMSSYRNIRFGFSGEVRKFYEYTFVIPLIPILLLGTLAALLYVTRIMNGQQLLVLFPVAVLIVYALTPWILGNLARYSLNHSQYGTAKFTTEITAGKYSAIYYKAAVLGVLLLLLIVAIVGGLFVLFGGPSSVDLSEPANDGTMAVFAMTIAIYLLLIPLFTFLRAYTETRTRNYQFNNTTLERRFALRSNISTGKLWRLELTNLLLIIFTLGLGYPWAAVRRARFMADHTQVVTRYSADEFVAQQAQQVSAMGEELGDAFDMDIAAGF